MFADIDVSAFEDLSIGGQAPRTPPVSLDVFADLDVRAFEAPLIEAAVDESQVGAPEEGDVNFDDVDIRAIGCDLHTASRAAEAVADGGGADPAPDPGQDNGTVASKVNRLAGLWDVVGFCCNAKCGHAASQSLRGWRVAGGSKRSSTPSNQDIREHVARCDDTQETRVGRPRGP